MHDPVDDVPPYSSFFQQMYDRHIAEIEAQERTLRIALTAADQDAGLRAPSINGKTSSPTVKTRVLKQRIIKKLDELAKVGKQMAPIVIGLRLDEIELAILCMDKVALQSRTGGASLTARFTKDRSSFSTCSTRTITSTLMP